MLRACGALPLGLLILLAAGCGGGDNTRHATPTASAVIADVVGAARKIVLGIGSVSTWKEISGKKIKPMDDIETKYYIRLAAKDRPGVLAQIATVFGENKISIASAIQPESDEATKTAEIVIMTHPAQEKAMQKALSELKKLDAVKEISNFIRVEEIEGN